LSDDDDILLVELLLIMWWKRMASSHTCWPHPPHRPHVELNVLFLSTNDACK
jgi:hypothetical protein